MPSSIRCAPHVQAIGVRCPGVVPNGQAGTDRPLPGAIGLIGITEIIGDRAGGGSENFVTALVSIPSIALGILVGTMVVRAVDAARTSPLLTRLAR